MPSSRLIIHYYYFVYWHFRFWWIYVFLFKAKFNKIIINCISRKSPFVLALFIMCYCVMVFIYWGFINVYIYMYCCYLYFLNNINRSVVLKYNTLPSISIDLFIKLYSVRKIKKLNYFIQSPTLQFKMRLLDKCV